MRLTLLGLALLTAACGTSTSTQLEITGDSIDALGKQFDAVSRQMTTGCINKVYTISACDTYRAFGEKFKQAYPALKTIWFTATQFDDQTLAGSAQAAFDKLRGDLAPYLILIGGS